MDLKRGLLATAFCLCAVVAFGQIPAPPATTSASLTSTTCPGTGCVQLNVSSYASAAIQITGTWTATQTFEVSVDGSTYQTISVTPTNSTTTVTTATGNGVWAASVAGQKYLRVRTSAYTSGTAVVTLQSALAGGGGGGGGGLSGSVQVTDGVDTAQVTATAGGSMQVECVSGCGGSGGTSAADGAAYVAGTTSGTPSMGARDDTGTTACAEDKVCIARVTSSRALLVDLSATGANTSKLLVTPDLPAGASTAAKQPALGTAGTASTDVITVQGIASMTKLLVTPDSVALPANQSVNVAQLAGTATSVNSGNKDAGTLRVVIATDQPALTNKFLVTPDSVALPANQSVNAAQWGGTNSVTGGVNGSPGVGGNTAHDAAGAGVNPVLVGCYASAAAPSDVSADADATRAWCLRNGALAFQPTFAGILTSTGVGAAGTGTARVVDVASGTTGSAPPTQASYLGGVTSGATGGLLGGITTCDSQAFLDMTTATTTEIVALTASRKVFVCYWLVESNGTAVVTFKRGTGTNCGTGTTTISPAWDLTAQTGFSGGSGVGVVFDNLNAGDALCVTSSAAVNVHVFMRYAKY